MPIPTSYRLHPDAVNLLIAWGRYQTAVKKRPISRGDIIEQLLAAKAPPSDDSPEAAAVRDAHKAFRATR